jgi:hypothetical protein
MNVDFICYCRFEIFEFLKALLIFFYVDFVLDSGEET